MRILFYLFVLFALSATGANAKYSLCNKSSYALSAAIGYVDGDRLATRDGGACAQGNARSRSPSKPIPVATSFFAEAIPGHRGPLRTWSGDTPLCVENSGFFNLRNQDVCRDDPMRQRKVFDVEVSESAGGNWQTDFTEASNYTVYSAEVAGGSRLLTDIGEDVGRIDGAMGRSTQRVLANYRKGKGLTEGTSIDDEVIDALIEDANAREAKLGFFYCNKTDDAVWSAIGEPDEEEAYASRGWWKLEPGDCAKIIKGDLEHDHYYVYGVIEEALTERHIFGGDKALCVKAIMFNATDDMACADQDLDEAMFRRVEIGGATSATFDFLPEMFIAPPTQ